jgi:hypothetical protein
MTNREKWLLLVERVKFLSKTNEYFKLRIPYDEPFLVINISGYTEETIPDWVLQECTKMVNDFEIYANALKSGKSFETSMKLISKKS